MKQRTLIGVLYLVTVQRLNSKAVELIVAYIMTRNDDYREQEDETWFLVNTDEHENEKKC